MSSYHADTYRLLGAPLEFSDSNEAEVHVLETHLGITLPASFREWYSRDRAIETLAHYSNADPVFPLQELELRTWRTLKLLPFRCENQGVCSWAIVLDDSDDPPVFVSDCTGRDEWQEYSISFSAYVYSCVWDYMFVLARPLLIQAQNQPLTATTLDELRCLFSQLVTTHGWPGHTQYRFERDDKHLLIWASDDQADWELSGKDAESVLDAMAQIWHLDRVGDSFWSHMDEGQVLVDRLRSEIRQRNGLE